MAILRYRAIPDIYGKLRDRWEHAKKHDPHVQKVLGRRQQEQQRQQAQRERHKQQSEAGLRQYMRENPHLAEAFHRAEAERQWVEEEAARTKKRREVERQERDRQAKAAKERQERKAQAIAEQEWRDVERESRGRITRRKLTEEALQRFYEKHNRKKVGLAKTLLESYSDQELLARLHKTYGAVPHLDL